MKLLEVVADVGPRAELVSLHDYVPHLGPDVGCIVVAVQESCLLNLLVNTTPQESCESSFKLRVTIKRNRNLTIYDRMECRSARSSFLGNFLDGAVCTSNAGDEMKA